MGSLTRFRWRLQCTKPSKRSIGFRSYFCSQCPLLLIAASAGGYWLSTRALRCSCLHASVVLWMVRLIDLPRQHSRSGESHLQPRPCLTPFRHCPISSQFQLFEGWLALAPTVVNVAPAGKKRREPV